MTIVDFMRHGRTEARDLLLGRTDLPLAPEGRAAVARQVAGCTWSSIVTSPLGRAKETADIAAEACGQPLEIDPDWREIDFGDWDGQLHDALARDARVAAFYRDPDAQPPPNGESMDEARVRIRRALDRLAARDIAGPVLVVTHGGAIRVALSMLAGIRFEQFWAVRIACATRIRVEMGTHPVHGLWAEIVEIAQPPVVEDA